MNNKSLNTCAFVEPTEKTGVASLDLGLEIYEDGSVDNYSEKLLKEK